jgi:hypothetical protein
LLGFRDINHALANFSYVVKLIVGITVFGFCIIKQVKCAWPSVNTVAMAA